MFTAADLVLLAMRMLQEGLDDRKSVVEADLLERAKLYVEVFGTDEEREVFRRLTAPRDKALASDIVARWPDSAILFPEYALRYAKRDADMPLLAELS
jgi:hypothetical protein